MPISTQGVTDAQGQLVLSWDDLNNQVKTDKARGHILEVNGVNAGDVPAILADLRTMEIAKYKEWKAVQSSKEGMKKQEKIPLLGKVMTAVEKAGGAIGHAVGAPGVEPGAYFGYKPPDFMKSSGLQALVDKVGMQERVDVAAGKQPGGGQQVAFPAISKEALQEYTKDYILPAQAQLNNMIQGDMSQWQQAINSIANTTGQQNSPITQAWQQYAKVQSPIYQSLAAATMRQGLTSPIANLYNSVIGEQAKIGERAMALGSQYNLLQQMGLLDPSAQGAISGLSGLGTAGSNLGLNPQSIVAAATATPKPYGA